MLIAAIIGIVLLVGADQLIKWWAVTELQPVGTKPFLHIGDLKILDLTYLENDGAVFSSFSGMRWFLVAVTAVMILACTYWLFRNRRHSKFLTLCLTLIIAGGIGNLIDRLFRSGRVVDYLNVKLFHFAVFNFADCCVVIGVILFACYLFFLEPRQAKGKNEAQPSEVSSASEDSKDA